jgi:hypothetical protein
VRSGLGANCRRLQRYESGSRLQDGKVDALATTASVFWVALSISSEVVTKLQPTVVMLNPVGY